MLGSVQNGEITMLPSDALLLIDLQPDFMPGGPLAIPFGDQILDPICEILPSFQTIVATQDWHPHRHISFASRHQEAPFSSKLLYGEEQTLWPDHCIQGSPGAKLHPQLPTEPIHLILRKGMHPDVDSYSAFQENVGPSLQRKSTGLHGFLQERGISRVFICGLARDFCVKYTALDAKTAGFSVIVLEDVCRSVFSDENHVQKVNQAFAQAGVYSKMTKEIL